MGSTNTKMMKDKKTLLKIMILAPLSIFMSTSCTENGNAKDPFGVEAEARSTELDNNSEYYNQRYRVYTLEGCEYIVVDSGNMKWGGHKGNCKNPIHQQNGR